MANEENVRNINSYGEHEADFGDSGFFLWDDRELSDELSGSKVKSPGIDKPMLVLTIVILLIGLIMVLSASFARGSYNNSEPLRLFFRQFTFAITGIVLMLVVSRISSKVFNRFSMQILLVAIILLILVPIIGIRANGARRWIGLGGENGMLTFQPSEIAKLALILAFSQMICRLKDKRMKTFKFGVIPFAVITGIIVVLLRMQPHMSAMIIVVALTAVMMFAGGTQFRWFLMVTAILAAMVGGLIFFQMRAADPDLSLSDMLSMETIRTTADFSALGYEGRRINAWMNPDSDPLGSGFQIRQSLNAVGSGGLLGLGLGQSRQKFLYLPEEHNDYIFAIVSEELGFIGAMLILMLFALLIVRGYWLAIHANDKFGTLVIIGITSLLALQVFLNIAVVANLLPATGISLPFFSYGGTALWLQLIQIGIILAISREIPAPTKEKNTV
ncbi:MAG: putative lipid II flippase FtsW [Oscillospiraceae bacterium]|jgi:cell division protein FtsW|nr:putative lipid II flippase FtsW [Oscillospiraceae bacterium]